MPTPVLRTFRDAGLLNQHQGDARQALRPYGGSRNVFGEGAVTMALETRAHAEARGARVLARLAGYRYGNGGDHPTRVDESGERPAQLIEEALDARVCRGTRSASCWATATASLSAIAPSSSTCAAYLASASMRCR